MYRVASPVEEAINNKEGAAGEGGEIQDYQTHGAAQIGSYWLHPNPSHGSELESTVNAHTYMS